MKRSDFFAKLNVLLIDTRFWGQTEKCTEAVINLFEEENLLKPWKFEPLITKGEAIDLLNMPGENPAGKLEMIISLMGMDEDEED